MLRAYRIDYVAPPLRRLELPREVGPSHRIERVRSIGDALVQFQVWFSFEFQTQTPALYTKAIREEISLRPEGHHEPGVRRRTWPSVAIDFDGTLVVHSFPACGPLRRGAKKNMQRLRDAGYYIIIHSCRSTVQDHLDHLSFGRQASYHEEMVNFLHEQEVPFDEVWVRQGKPTALKYVDDKSSRLIESADGGDNWDQVVDEILAIPVKRNVAEQDQRPAILSG